jgi:hypothetical protein
VATAREIIARQRAERRAGARRWADAHTNRATDRLAELEHAGAGRRRRPSEMYSGELRESYRLLGQDPDTTPEIHELVKRGIAPIAGGATGKGAAAFFLNMPPQGTYSMDVPYFNQETERNDVPQQSFAFTGLGGSRMDQRVTNVGILAFVRLIFIGSLVVAGSGTVTANYPWPWNIAKRVSVQANGQTSLMQAEGLDFRARRQRLFRKPTESISTAPATTAATGDPNPGVIANGTYPVVLVYDLPIVHDMTTLTGALFAQSDSNYLSYTVEPALSGDLFTLAGGSTATLTGTFWPQLTYFDIPYVDSQQGRVVAIPDLRWLHGYIASNQAFASTGDIATPLIKNAGQLIAFYQYIDNGGAAQISWLTAVDQFRLEYGGNRKPIVWSGPAGQGPLFGLEENERNYNGLIQPGYLVLDLENDNPDRDLIYPRGVSELQGVAKITAGTTINGNAHMHFVEETLFSGS